MQPVKIIIVGAGDRGMLAYAPYIVDSKKGIIVGVAEPNPVLRKRAKERYDIPAEKCFTDWRELSSQTKFADACLICTQDQDHADPAIMLLNQGYDVLLEKPMAVTEEDCRAIVASAIENNAIFAVGHVLRYTAYNKMLRKLMDQGAIGDLVTIRHLEPVGWKHQAHSFVRGKWGNQEESSFMLLAKSCHDLDLLQFLANRKCLKISSFGSLKHFKTENAPAGATKRCLDCPKDVEAKCPYSAKKIYLTVDPEKWPARVITNIHTPGSVMEAIENGPYGWCVYKSNNDVVDHQVVNMEFEDEVTATFTMTAFNKGRARETSIMGTHGEIVGDGRYIKVYDFVKEEETVYDSEHSDTGIVSGHGGGDEGLAEAFVDAVAAKDPSLISSGPEVSLESHLMVFAAERSRLNETVEKIKS